MSTNKRRWLKVEYTCSGMHDYSIITDVEPGFDAAKKAMSDVFADCYRLQITDICAGPYQEDQVTNQELKFFTNKFYGDK